MTASSNFGNVLSVLVASAFLPMLPLQLLVQNLLYDVGQVGIPFDNVDADRVAKPLKWNPADIGRFMLCFGPVSSVFDIITFAVMWWVLHANSIATQTLFQSGWFVVGLLTQTLIVHMIRTPKIAFLQSRASLPLTLMTVAIMALGVWLPTGSFAADFKLQSLPAAFYAWLVAILVAYCALTTIMKRFHLRRFGWQGEAPPSPPARHANDDMSPHGPDRPGDSLRIRTPVPRRPRPTRCARSGRTGGCPAHDPTLRLEYRPVRS